MENVFHIFLPLSTFTQYTENANAGNGLSFSNYSKNGNDIPNNLNSYGKGAYVVGSSFSSYGEAANGSYGDGNNAAVNSFSSYRDQSNVGDNSFQSYTKNSNGEKGQGAVGQPIGFKIYGRNNTFKDYSRKGIVFGRYNYGSSSETAQVKASGSVVNKWVEPGKFFREKLLKRGTVMPMLEIRDKIPSASERGARRDQAVCGVGGGHDRFRHLGSGAERGGWFDGEREGVKAEHKDRKR
ncbi:hypothetical protein Gogos_021411 [Gossypium gossypioides]|uniref:BURP domain-containing protein n=1 Tax=Gossypium gossypioides TaxID=34282 RepID=A0A7J9D3A6_GOSGO|nr:hypothetical protein [Gossypium gossypioides]